MSRTTLTAVAVAVAVLVIAIGLFAVSEDATPSAEPPSQVTATVPTPTTALEPTETRLPPELTTVTDPWPTAWTRRTIDLEELKIGLPAIDPRDLIRPLDHNLRARNINHQIFV